MPMHTLTCVSAAPQSELLSNFIGGARPTNMHPHARSRRSQKLPTGAPHCGLNYMHSASLRYVSHPLCVFACLYLYLWPWAVQGGWVDSNGVGKASLQSRLHQTKFAASAAASA